VEKNWEVVFQDSEVKDISLEYKGVLIPIKVRDLSWSERNQILGKCFNYQTDGNISFDFDKYMKESLSKMIVKAPWGETNSIFFAKISKDFGAMLEKMVPKAFEEAQMPDFFVSGQSTSSKEQ